jgi:hypothetical protein
MKVPTAAWRFKGTKTSSGSLVRPESSGDPPDSPDERYRRDARPNEKADPKIEIPEEQHQDTDPEYREEDGEAARPRHGAAILLRAKSGVHVRSSEAVSVESPRRWLVADSTRDA